MGKRYQAILSHLGKSFCTADIETPNSEIMSYAKASDGIVLATPTGTHVDYIQSLAHLKRPILCEKPIAMNLTDLKTVREIVEKTNLNFSMTLQYKMLDFETSRGPSKYNYFRHGNDGLVWDCIQIIGLARGEVSLSESSPIWECILNNRVLNLSMMDRAYVDFVQEWLISPGQDIGWIMDMHYKTQEMAERLSG